LAKRNLNIFKFLSTVYDKKDLLKTQIKEDVKKEDVEKKIDKKVVIDDSLLFKYSFCSECKPSI